MQMFVAMPQGTVICTCCSGPGRRILHVIGMFVATPHGLHMQAIWQRFNGSFRAVLYATRK